MGTFVNQFAFNGWDTQYLRFNPPLWKADGLRPRLCFLANLINPSRQG